MTFLHQPWLWLLPLAAIPIVLHLLTLHRLKTVELSTFRFLFDSYVQQRRRMQFLEALLAMLRAAFLLLLVLAVSRPVVRHWSSLFQAGSGREVIFFMDCSASMNARAGGLTAFERAKTAALAVAERLDANDRLTLIRVTAKPEEVFSRFASDVAIRDKIENLQTTPGRANLFMALTQTFGPEAPRRGNPVVYLFSDCQASGWREARGQGTGRLLPEGSQMVVVNVGSNEAVANLAVVGDAPGRQRAVVGLPVHLQPRVVNYSRTETAEVALTVLIDEKEISRTTLTLKPGETATRKLIYVPAEPGNHRGRFDITGKKSAATDSVVGGGGKTAGFDQFPDDDRFLFSLPVRPRAKVLLLNGNPAADPFENESLYLRNALSITEIADEKKSGSGAQKPEPRSDQEMARSFETVDVAENRLTQEALKDVSVVIVANCGALAAPQFGWLQDFVYRGGGLIVFPGDRVKADVYNGQFFQVPGPQGDQLTAARLGPPQGEPEKAGTFEHLSVIDFAHPALAVFDDADAGYFRSVQFFRRFALTLPKRKTDNTWSLAQFSSGTAALVESRFGEGMVLVAAFPANVKWTNLPLKPEFVPLLLRLVSHVEHRAEVEGPSAVQPGGTAEINVAGRSAPISGKITDPAGHSHPLAFERSGSRFLAAFDQTGAHGYYTAQITGGPAGQPTAGEVVFAVNLAPEESDFATLGETQFHELLPGTELTFVDASAEAQQLYGTLGDEQEIWRPLIWILFIVIGVEFTLATLGGQKNDVEENPAAGDRISQFNTGSVFGRLLPWGRKKHAG